MSENTSGQFAAGQIPPIPYANTSGQGPRAVVPPEIRRWNWGAFLLNWIWGIGNETYSALLCFIPLVNFVMIFVLGAKGSEWAWRNKRWKDVAHFRRVQRNWAIAGLVVFGASVALFTLGVILVVVLFGRSEAYRTAVAELKANPTAISELGTPITTGFPSGNIAIKNDTGRALLSFSASGPKAAGTVYVAETLHSGLWVITRMQLQIMGSDRRIDLVNRSSVADRSVYPKPAQTITRPIQSIGSTARALPLPEREGGSDVACKTKCDSAASRG